MHYLMVFLFVLHCSIASAGTAEEAAQAYLDAVDGGNAELIAELVHESLPNRIGKSIQTVITTCKSESNCNVFLQDVFGKVVSAKEVSSLTPLQIYAKYSCRDSSGRPEDRAAVDGLRVSTKMIGKVEETELLIHVLFRHTIEGNLAALPVPQDYQPAPELVTCQKVGNAWKIVLPPSEFLTYQQLVMDHLQRERQSKESTEQQK